MQLETKIKSGGESIFSHISRLSKKHGAINLGQGFPDFPVSTELKQLVAKYANGIYDQYAPMKGQLKLRSVLAKKYNQAYACQLDAEKNITITAGATQGIFGIIQAVVKTGDEVIIIEPAYDSYAPSIEVAGGKIIPIALNENFRMDWNLMEDAINDKTQLIILNNPHNPSGQTFDENDINTLEQLVSNRNILILSDEVYEHLVYDGKEHQSMLRYPSLFERCFCVYSFGKTFHATGWKMGYVIASEQLTNAFREIHQWMVFSVNSFVQMALAEYLEDPKTYQNLAPFYQEKRDFFTELMNSTRFKKIPSKGSYFQLYDYSEIDLSDDLTFAERLITEHGVSVIPISPFYTNKPKQHVIRFCFAKEKTTLSSAVRSLSQI